MIHDCNIRNYSICFRKLPYGAHYLFSYFECIGDDFAADMAKMRIDGKTRNGWNACKPCQQPLRDRAPGEWWADMEEVFHCD